MLLHNCSSTYFEPELFRLNTNQFLQTARTVTFIIQKNKDSINEFDTWYQNAVINSWRNDELMTWAKESRNKIEKQGDLELNSSLDVSLIFSYFEQEDIKLKIGKDELLGYGIKKLVRLAQKSLPTGISDAASVRVCRKWVTVGLENWELLNALVYIYCRHYDVYQSLCYHMGISISPTVMTPNDASNYRELWRNPTYIKLRGLKSFSHSIETITYDTSSLNLEEFTSIMDKAGVAQERFNTHEGAKNYFFNLSKALFERDGFHISVVHLFDRQWTYVDMIGVQFEDQADKYIFWRSMAERVAAQNIGAIVWISELWHRSSKGYPNTAIRNLPILGEALHVEVFDYEGNYSVSGWKIERDLFGNNPTIEKLSDLIDPETIEMPNYLEPVSKAMGQVAHDKFVQLNQAADKVI